MCRITVPHSPPWQRPDPDKDRSADALKKAALPNTSFGYQTATHLVRRGGVWQYRRRVPKSIAPHLGCTEIRVSTNARDRTQALRAAAQMTAALKSQWATLIGAQHIVSEPTTACQTPLATAEALGVAYRPVQGLASSRLEDLIARIERLADPLGQRAGLLHHRQSQST